MEFPRSYWCFDLFFVGKRPHFVTWNKSENGDSLKIRVLPLEPGFSQPAGLKVREYSVHRRDYSRNNKRGEISLNFHYMQGNKVLVKEKMIGTCEFFYLDLESGVYEHTGVKGDIQNWEFQMFAQTQPGYSSDILVRENGEYFLATTEVNTEEHTRTNKKKLDLNVPDFDDTILGKRTETTIDSQAEVIDNTTKLTKV